MAHPPKATLFSVQFVVACSCVLFATSSLLAGVAKGRVIGGDDPWVVRADDGIIYKVEWYGGYSLWSEDDRVLLTTTSGRGKMIGLDNDEDSEVWIDEVD